MEFKGTKGDLLLKECYYSLPVLKIENAKREVFAIVPMKDNFMNRFGEEMYNAKLICKAPEMLELLSEIFTSIEYDEISEQTDYYKEKIQKLINEATNI